MKYNIDYRREHVKKVCKYPRCRSRYIKVPGHEVTNKHYYQFPQNNHYKQLWKNALKLEDHQITKFSVICEDHFEPHQFVNQSKRKLNKNVVPIPVSEDYDSNTVPVVYSNLSSNYFNATSSNIKSKAVSLIINNEEIIVEHAPSTSELLASSKVKEEKQDEGSPNVDEFLLLLEDHNQQSETMVKVEDTLDHDEEILKIKNQLWNLNIIVNDCHTRDKLILYRPTILDMIKKLESGIKNF